MAFLGSPKASIPVFTALLGTVGIAGGLYTFLSPGATTARIFGIVLPPSLAVEVEAMAPTHRRTEEASRQRAYIQIHGIRNLASGVGLIGLTLFWAFSPLSRSSRFAAEALKKSLGILLATGSLVSLADGYILSRYLKNCEGLSSEGKEVATKQSKGHYLTTLPIIALAFSWWFVQM